MIFSREKAGHLVQKTGNLVQKTGPDILYRKPDRTSCTENRTGHLGSDLGWITVNFEIP
jgi:hypothetical protein